MKNYFCMLHWLAAGLLLLATSSANAARLSISPDAHWMFHSGAAIVLYAHIVGGTIGIISGLIASVSKKGKLTHRLAGKIFFFSMLTCYVLAAIVSPFLDSEQKTNTIAAVLALYLLLSGVGAARRVNFKAGVYEKIGLVVAIGITIIGFLFMYIASNSPTATVDGGSADAYMLFVVAGSIAAIGELNVIIRKTLTPASRIVRHLWRMCFSFFIASGSLFFGQAEFLPSWFNETLLSTLFGLFPFFVLVVGVLVYKNPLIYVYKIFRGRGSYNRLDK